LLQYANPIVALESFRSSSFRHFKASSNLRLACALFENLDKAHVIRYFVESIPLDSKGKEIPGSKGNEGREYINKLFKIEKEISDLSLEKKLEKRQEEGKPLLEAFWLWVEKTKELYTTNEGLIKALNYATNHKENLMRFLEDPKIPVSNNRCESAIRPFATQKGMDFC